LKTTNHPLVTVGIPCFNAEATIRRAVDSGLTQTWPYREILIVDDASTDSSGAILADLERVRPEIRVVWHESNRGFPEAANTLLAQAHGEFIAFLGADDESHPGRLEQQYRRIVGYEATHSGAIVLCYSDRTVVPIGEHKSAFQHHGIGRVPPEPFGSSVVDYLLGLLTDDAPSWGMVGSGTLMARTDALRRLGGFDARFRRAADFDLAIRAAFAGAHFIGVDSPLIVQHVTQSAEKAGNADLRYGLLLLEKHKAYLKERKSYRGAWFNMHARFYRERHWRWRLWYVAALACFPWRVSRERLKRSSLLARLGLVRAQVVSREPPSSR
jgi:glycosyltransferase involved in cell wall biosynthesis